MPNKKKLVDNSTNFKESPLRSILKTISWRILATATTIIIVYFVFDDITKAFTAGIFEVSIKLVVYYLHERAWINIKWGKNWSRRRKLKKIRRIRALRDFS